jgi:hypothetical protein
MGMGIGRTRMVWVLGLFAAACMAAGNGKSGGKSDGKTVAAAAVPAATEGGKDRNRCPPGKQTGLASWEAGPARMRVSYCSAESTDAQGVTVFSRLDVRQEDRASDKVIWKIHDEAKPGLRKVQLFRPGFAMQDVDGDGTRETFIGYYFPGDGLDPVEFKFLAHKDGKKYAIRGQLPRTEDDAALYKAVRDPAFAGVPPRFRSVTDSLFTAFITSLCTDPDLGLGVPVPARILAP